MADVFARSRRCRSAVRGGAAARRVRPAVARLYIVTCERVRTRWVRSWQCLWLSARRAGRCKALSSLCARPARVCVRTVNAQFKNL